MSWKRWKVTIIVCMVAMAVVGTAMFPYAPIKPKGDVCVDKLAYEHTEIQYRLYRIWENTLMVVGILFGATTIINLWYERTTRSTQK